MMSDIRSFTTLVEHLPPEQVVTLLNRYLGKMTDIILEHGGTIDEFLGDAVLAAFGAPSDMKDMRSARLPVPLPCKQPWTKLTVKTVQMVSPRSR